MKRYDIDQNSLFSNDDGDWVQYEDVKEPKKGKEYTGDLIRLEDLEKLLKGDN